MRKVKIQVEEEILQIGLEHICKEEYEIVSEITEDSIYITDKEDNKAQIILYSDIVRALTSTANIKLLKSATKQELLEAIKKAVEKQPYTQKRIEEETNKFYQTAKITKELSQRQKELIKLIIEGNSNKDIAKKLYLSEKTIKNNLSELYKKIGVKNRTEVTKKMKNHIDTY